MAIFASATYFEVLPSVVTVACKFANPICTVVFVCRLINKILVYQLPSTNLLILKVHKYIGKCHKSYNHKVNHLIDNYLDTEKKSNNINNDSGIRKYL